MKLNNLYHIALVGLGGLALALSVSSCDLTRKPTDYVPTNESLLDFDDAVDYNRGILSQFRNRIGGQYAFPQEYMADCLHASANFGNRNGDIYGWAAMNSSTDVFASVYRMYYSTLKNVNYTLERYEPILVDLEAKLAELKKDEKKNENAIRNVEDQIFLVEMFRANSQFARAFYYFNLLQRFGRVYDPENESTLLGVPMVTTYDVFAQLKRSTLKECYDQIYKDLDASEAFFKQLKNKQGRYFTYRNFSVFTADAMTALRARMALERKEYDKAYQYANELIQSGHYPLISPTAEAFEKMWVYDSSTEEICQLPIAVPEEEPNGWGSYFGFGHWRKFVWNNPDFIVSKGLLDMYESKDLRKNFYFSIAPMTNPDVESQNIIGQMYVVSKFKGNPEYDNIKDDPYLGHLPAGNHKPRVFRMAEQYLIAAEAAYFSGAGDALEPLNALRVSRGLDPVSSSGEALLKDIQDERLRELCLEGFRLWDLRRWNLPIKRMAVQEFFKEDGTKRALSDYIFPRYYDLTIETSDPKYQRTVWPIPMREINVYGAENMPQNPGW